MQMRPSGQRTCSRCLIQSSSVSRTWSIPKKEACSRSALGLPVAEIEDFMGHRVLNERGSGELLAARGLANYFYQRGRRRKAVSSGPVAGHIITDQNHRGMIIFIGDCGSQRLKQ